MTTQQRFLIVLTVVSFLTVTSSMNAYAKKNNAVIYGSAGGLALLSLIFAYSGDSESAREAREQSREILEKGLGGNYVAGQETLPLMKHLNRMNAIEFVGPESQGRASQYDNSGVTYSLFEW